MNKTDLPPDHSPSPREECLVVELDERDIATEAIDEAHALGFRPALVAFLNEDGDTRLFTIGVEHRSFLEHLAEEFGPRRSLAEHAFGCPDPGLGN